MRSGIPTTYRSTNFRSRLEARWAAFFDLIGWSWVYEPLDADGYIPDFLIQGPHPLFVEVGPCVTEQDYREKAAKPDVAWQTLGHDVLVVGVSPMAPSDMLDRSHAFGVAGDELVAGWFGEVFEDGLGWAAGVWSPCGGSTDSRLAVFHATGSFGHRPCADSTYGGHPTTFGRGDHRVIDTLWAEAGNRVQWKRAA